jgi:hypothetical protein
VIFSFLDFLTKGSMAQGRGELVSRNRGIEVGLLAVGKEEHFFG